MLTFEKENDGQLVIVSNRTEVFSAERTKTIRTVEEQALERLKALRDGNYPKKSGTIIEKSVYSRLRDAVVPNEREVSE